MNIPQFPGQWAAFLHAVILGPGLFILWCHKINRFDAYALSWQTDVENVEVYSHLGPEITPSHTHTPLVRNSHVPSPQCKYAGKCS